jgi:hypothetical protein
MKNKTNNEEQDNLNILNMKYTDNKIQHERYCMLVWKKIMKINGEYWM